VRPDVDPTLVAVATRAMAKRPEERYQSADQMRGALDHEPTITMTTAAPILPVADTTVPMAPAAASPTVVAPVATTVTRPAAGRSRHGIDRRLLVVCALGLLGLFAAAAALNLRNHGHGTVAVAADQQALVDRLKDLGRRVHDGDGPMGPELEKQLNSIADDVAAGHPAGDKATATLLAVKTWHDAHQLGDAATSQANELLGQVPGVNASAANPPPAPVTTVAPTTAPPTTQPQPRPAKKHGKGGKGD
jgi:hypothetical protein